MSLTNFGFLISMLIYLSSVVARNKIPLFDKLVMNEPVSIIIFRLHEIVLLPLQRLNEDFKKY
uniref:Uncharacterized protein n=1 Tax=Rhizophora mucronata TaxID=61149 RepID=A0A2P2PU00_RHIMU